jgi:ubiquinone/menaquinone biosynthesis C-methylase UbiE
MWNLDDQTTEIARIRAEYARRSSAIPKDYYSWGRAWNHFFHTQLCRECIRGLSSDAWFPLSGKSIADIGCGTGAWLLEFCQWDADSLHGIDLDDRRLARARERLPQADLHLGDATQLPWADESFDLVSQFTVFTSILSPAVKQAIALEMLRVLKPGGFVLWYDFRVNNPRNAQVAGIEAEEIRKLFRGCRTTLRKVTLAPPIARAIVPLSWTIGSLLEKLPFLRTHYFGLIQKPD